MRTKYLLMFALFLFSLSSCFKETIDFASEKTDDSFATSRAMVSSMLGTSSTSNPDLYEDWENVQTIMLNQGNLDVYAPWVVRQGNSVNIPDEIRLDIKKADGWTMLGHTIERKNSGEPNYILFYHKKSGILKGFYYNIEQQPNEKFRWILEADKASSLIPSNTKYANLSNKPVQYASASNLLVQGTTSASSSLRSGWNCFTFELPYGPIHNNPLISIDGYNTLNFDFEANGNFSGQVIVPKAQSSNSLSSLIPYFTSVSSLTGAAGLFEGALKKAKEKDKKPVQQNFAETRMGVIGVLGIISAATSIISNVIGSASHFTSKQQNIVHRYNLGGNMELTGTVKSGMLPGLVSSINRFDIKALNNDESLGVWGLSKSPKITIKRYEEGSLKEGRENEYTRTVYLHPILDKKSVIINPSLDIKDYKVSVGYIYEARSKTDKLLNAPYVEISDSCFLAEIKDRAVEVSASHRPGGILYPVGQEPMREIIYLAYMKKLPDIYMSVLVDIEYTDGSVLSSSRVFKVDTEIIDNKSDIVRMSSKDFPAVFKDFVR